jgi:hypothetical protein
MPLLHISMRAGKPETYRQAIFDSLYRAMREALNVPEDNQFMTLSEHEAANFRYGASYLGVLRSDDLVYLQITVFNTRQQSRRSRFSVERRSCSAKTLASAQRTCSSTSSKPQKRTGHLAMGKRSSSELASEPPVYLARFGVAREAVGTWRRAQRASTVFVCRVPPHAGALVVHAPFRVTASKCLAPGSQGNGSRLAEMSDRSDCAGILNSECTSLSMRS